MKLRYAEQVRLCSDLLKLLGIRKLEDAILIVIGQHAEASDEVMRLQAEIDKLRAQLAAVRGEMH
jgi:uncharacterized small protein (DUF1192 family)